MNIMRVGEVIFADDSDFDYFKKLALNDEEWKLEYNKHSTKVWTKNNEFSVFKMIKARSEYKDVSPEDSYDMIHDSDYRKTWDTSMVEGFEICWVSPNSDIGYYSLRCPKPFKRRDFVTQRCWLDFGMNHEKIIFNHSVQHKVYQHKKGYIRGQSYLTGYYMTPFGDNGCQMTYVTLCDPKGALPVWAVNKVASVLAPKMMNKIYKASRSYPSWKRKNNPDFRPWRNPEQQSISRLNLDDIITSQSTTVDGEDSEDESAIKENDFDEKGIQ